MPTATSKRHLGNAAKAPEAGRATSIDKAFEVCEALAGVPAGLSVKELSQSLGLPPATTHRLLAGLRRRGYVRQDEETARYRLTLKMLDLSFRLLGRSEVRLHAYPVVREFVLRTGARAFIASPSGGEVTYVWTAGPDEVAMHTVYGREMPAHCSIYLEPEAPRRLSCLKLARAADVGRASDVVVRFGTPPANVAPPRLNCTCAPVFDYTGREVARVGLFAHSAGEGALLDAGRGAWELAGLISLRLGHLPTVAAVGM